MPSLTGVIPRAKKSSPAELPQPQLRGAASEKGHGEPERSRARVAAGDLGGQGAPDPRSPAAMVLGEQGDAGRAPEQLPAFSPGS